MKKLAIAALAALSLPTPALAAELIKNGSFEINTVTTAGTMGWIYYANLADWSYDKRTVNNAARNFTFVATPGSADNINNNSGGFSVYGPFPTTSPDGGDFIFADADPNYNGALYQTVSGLTVGEKYTLTFWQAAGQQYQKTGPTTEQWKVTFGNNTQYSDKFTLPQGGVGDWQQQSMDFIATQTSQVLTFLAQGTPSGQPPVAMLDGVSLKVYQPPVTAVPEPATWAMMIMGFGAVAGVMRRRPHRAAVVE